jgi:hypothetical protein
MVVTSCSVFIGLTMYARYADCDPFTTGAVKKNDQLLPYFIMDVASHIPGLSGLFIAGIFCAALSTLSACLNCVAGTMYEDFVLKVTGPIDDDKRAAYIFKAFGSYCGGTLYPSGLRSRTTRRHFTFSRQFGRTHFRTFARNVYSWHSFSKSNKQSESSSLD